MDLEGGSRKLLLWIFGGWETFSVKHNVILRSLGLQ
jgi:hypothetical protein